MMTKFSSNQTNWRHLEIRFSLRRNRVRGWSVFYADRNFRTRASSTGTFAASMKMWGRTSATCATTSSRRRATSRDISISCTRATKCLRMEHLGAEENEDSNLVMVEQLLPMLLHIHPVCQKWKSWTVEILLTFLCAITKRSNLLLLDRHQTACTRCLSVYVIWARSLGTWAPVWPEKIAKCL